MQTQIEIEKSILIEHPNPTLGAEKPEREEEKQRVCTNNINFLVSLSLIGF